MVLFIIEKVDESMKAINKKGLTLVELLAVLIVLIIIFMIAVAKVNDIMDDAEAKSVKGDAISYVKAVNDYFLLQNGVVLYPVYEGVYDVDTLQSIGIQVSGTKPTGGYLYNVDNKTVYGCLTYKKRRAIIEDNNVTKVDLGKCTFKDGYNSKTKSYFADYTGSEEVFTVRETGRYILEVWGAQGGDSQYNAFKSTGGYGGYSKAYINLTEGDQLYINVGGKGNGSNYKQNNGNVIEYDNYTGYNGGGYAVYANNNSTYVGGGGATHIALSSGLLMNLSSKKDDVLIVAGGGGGSGAHGSYPSYSGNGGSGGGYIGGNGVPHNNTCYNYGTGGTQTAVGSYLRCATDSRAREGYQPSAPAFGLGGNFQSNSGSRVYAGGGGGWYGGQSGYHGPGAGGSGYIGNSYLINPEMYCYNCEESTDYTTKTTSTTKYSEEPKSYTAKVGNGFARIIYIGDLYPGKDTYTDPIVEQFNNKFADYKRLKYIQSNGTQNILTNIIPTDTTGISIDLESTNVTDDGIYIGCMGNDNKFWIGNKDGKGYFARNDVVTFTSSNIRTRERYLVQLNYKNNRSYIHNGTTVLSNIATFGTSNKPLSIFSDNYDGDISYNSSIRLYSLEITDGANVVANYLPCSHKTNGTIGLCDLVSGTFYDNDGTGTFTKGDV